MVPMKQNRRVWVMSAGVVFGLIVWILQITADPGGPPDDRPPEPPPPAPEARMADAIDVSLADLLKKPRAELAEMADELAANVQIQRDSLRKGTLSFTL